jgi:hypothetical protein
LLFLTARVTDKNIEHIWYLACKQRKSKKSKGALLDGGHWQMRNIITYYPKIIVLVHQMDYYSAQQQQSQKETVLQPSHHQNLLLQRDLEPVLLLLQMG